MAFLYVRGYEVRSRPLKRQGHARVYVCVGVCEHHGAVCCAHDIVHMVARASARFGADDRATGLRAVPVCIYGYRTIAKYEQYRPTNPYPNDI